MKKLLKEKTYYLLAFIHTFITFFTDKFYFEYKFSLKLILMKITLFIIFSLLYKLLFTVIKGVKEKDERIIRNLKIFLIYFSIMMVFVLICYPGNFKNDEMLMFGLVKELEARSFFHVLTYYIYAYYLMILPFIGGMAIIQNFICSLIAVYIYDKATINKKFTKYSYLIIVPFLFLPVISQNLYPYRPTMYAYFEIFFIFYLYFKYKNKEKIDLKFFILTGLFTAILAIFRSECIYYLICAPIGILMFFVKKENLKKYFIYLCVTLLAFGLIKYDQDINDSQKGVYNSFAYVIPLSYMVNTDLKGNNVKEDLNKISKVFYMDKLKSCPSYKDIDPVWKCQAFKYGKSKKEYKEGINAFLDLAINNPKPFFEARLKTFLATSALDSKASNTIFDSSILFDPSKNYIHETYTYFGTLYKLNKPISPNRRANMIRFIEGRNIHDYNKFEFTYYIFYDLIIPILFLFIYCIYKLFKKEWFYSLLFLLVFIKVPLIFLTATACYFMYYFSTYFIAYILMFLCIYDYLYNRKYKNKKKK